MNSLTAMRVFVTVSNIGIVLFLLYSIVFGHISFQWMCMTNNTERSFLDYFKHLLFSADPTHLYENATGEWGCFPPFIYLLYSLMYNMTVFLGITPESWKELMLVDEALTVFIYYSVIVLVSMLLAIQLWQKKKGAFSLFLCLILSAPFFAGIERGNSVILVFVFLLFVLKWRNEESRIKRELALILIAVSAAIKIYPAVFGLLYIKEKRWNEAVRLLIYGIAFFFLPFLSFGGINGFQHWLSNVDNTLLTYSVGRIEYIRGLVMTASYITTKSTADYLALVLPNIYLILMMTLFFLTTDSYRAVFYLCAMMTFYPSNAFRYTLCYLAVPLVMYLMEHGEEKVSGKLQFTEMICFGLLFTVPTLFGLFTNFNGLMYPQNDRLTYVEFRLYIVAYLILGMIVGHELVEIFKYKRIDRNLLKNVGSHLKDADVYE